MDLDNAQQRNPIIAIMFFIGLSIVRHFRLSEVLVCNSKFLLAQNEFELKIHWMMKKVTKLRGAKRSRGLHYYIHHVFSSSIRFFDSRHSRTRLFKLDFLRKAENSIYYKIEFYI